MPTFSKNMVKQFKAMLKKSPKNHGIRIYAAAGCCGPSLALAVADGPKRGDVTLETTGITIFLEKEAKKLITNTTLDYTAEEGIVIGGMPQSSCCG